MIEHALINLRPGAPFKVTETGTENIIEWLDPSTIPLTDAEIAAEVSRLKADYAAKQYQRDRQKAYPSFADQFDLLYHGGYDAWKAVIQEVKDQYPKP